MLLISSNEDLMAIQMFLFLLVFLAWRAFGTFLGPIFSLPIHKEELCAPRCTVFSSL